MVCKYCEGPELDKNNAMFNHAYSNTDRIFRWTKISLYSGHNAALKTKFLFKDYEEDNTIPINYCPMCGRKLREDNNMISSYYFGEDEDEDEEKDE